MVIHDKQLSLTAKVVFCELALWLKRGEQRVSRGQRSIAENIGLHQETVGMALKELAVRGHISIEPAGRGKRSSYLLLDRIYRETPKRERRAA